jgi:predicted dienelactone hydrolase
LVWLDRFHERCIGGSFLLFYFSHWTEVPDYEGEGKEMLVFEMFLERGQAFRQLIGRLLHPCHHSFLNSSPNRLPVVFIGFN